MTKIEQIEHFQTRIHRFSLLMPIGDFHHHHTLYIMYASKFKSPKNRLLQRGLCERMVRDKNLMQCVMLEVQRLWPPFFGGRRLVRKVLQDPEILYRRVAEVRAKSWQFASRVVVVAQKELNICGHRVQPGCAVVYMTRHAQRDPEVFSDPDSFDPERWTGR